MVMNSIAKEIVGQARILKISLDKNSMLKIRMQINKVLTVIILKGEASFGENPELFLNRKLWKLFGYQFEYFFLA
jgi:hypothetical protein